MNHSWVVFINAYFGYSVAGSHNHSTLNVLQPTNPFITQGHMITNMTIYPKELRSPLKCLCHSLDSSFLTQHLRSDSPSPYSNSSLYKTTRQREGAFRFNKRCKLVFIELPEDTERQAKTVKVQLLYTHTAVDNQSTVSTHKFKINRAKTVLLLAQSV